MKKEIFRAGDYIEIIEPKFVKRVGYPIHPSDFYETLKRDPNVLAALKLIGISPEYEEEASHGIFKMRTSLNVPQELVKAIAFIKTRQQGFGGNIRSIHYIEEDLSAMKDSFFMVHAKKVVKTGIRVPPCIGGYNMFDCEHEYEPGYLEGEKTHVILNILHNRSVDNGSVNFKSYWIETCNVKKM